MSRPPRDGETGEDAGERTGRDSSAGTPAWVKVAAAIGVVLVLALIALLVFGGGSGSHGPGRHLGDAGSASGAAVASLEGEASRWP